MPNLDQQLIAIPTLSTQRLALVPLSETHSQGMFDLWSDPLVCKHSGEIHDAEGNRLPMPASNAATSDLIIKFWLEAANFGWGFRWAVLLAGTDTFVGTLGFNALAPTAEVAYHQSPAFWGQGYMGEATVSALTWVEQTYHPLEIEAFIEPANFGSVRLVERLRFVATAEYSEGARRYVRRLA